MNLTAGKTLQPVYSFLLIVIFFQVTGGLMGWITAQDVNGWYRTLELSPLNPPDPVFGMAWAFLYFLLSVAFWILWWSSHPDRKAALSLFIGHMILNWVWTPLFFTLHALLAAYILILMLIFTGAMLAYILWGIDRRASILLMPYILWLVFAGHLSHFVFVHN